MQKGWLYLVGVGSLCAAACFDAHGQQTAHSSGDVTSPVRSASAAQDVKVLPGAILTVWKDEDLSQPELAMMVDKAKAFDNFNGKADPAVQAVGMVTSRWSGILNVEKAGLYTFNAIHNSYRGGGRVTISINDVRVMEIQGNGTMSKNVKIPGPVNFEVTIVGPCDFRFEKMTGTVRIRYKKAGKIEYSEVTPEVLFHRAD